MMKNNWPTKKLGEVCRVIKGKKPYLKKTQEKGDLPYLVARFLRGEKKPEYASKSDKNSVLVYENEIIIICDGSNSGDIFYGFNGILSSTMGKIAHSEAADTGYLKLFLQLNFNLFNSTKKGAAIPHLDINALYNLSIPLPTIGEQRKIVKKIEKLFVKIDEAQKLREESKKSASALLQSALNEIFSGPKFPLSLKLRRASKNWEEKYFGDIVKIDTARNAKFLPYIGMEDIESGNGNFIGSHESRKVRSTTFYFNKHHVLYGKLRPYLNKFFLPDFEGHCTTEFLPLLPDKKFLIREWLAFWLRNENTVSEIMKTTTGSRMPRANMHQVRKFKIPFPPLAEQKKIVAYLDSLSEKVRELQKFQNETEKDLVNLKQSILQKSFSGKL